MMRWRAILPVLAMLGLLAAPAHATLQSDYLEIYVKLNDSVQLENKGDLAGALAGFEDCYTRLRKIHVENPDWENVLVVGRMGDCRTKIIEIQSKLAATQRKASTPKSAGPVDGGKTEGPKARLAELQQAVKASPHDPSAYRNLGAACFQLGHIDAAIDALDHAIALDPNNVYAHNYLGCALMRKGRVEAAAKEFHKTLEIDEGFTEGHYNLAILYATEDPPAMAAARTHYKRALELGLVSDPHLAKVLHVSSN